MAWSKELPIEPGYYWCRWPGNWAGVGFDEVLRVYVDEISPAGWKAFSIGSEDVIRPPQAGESYGRIHRDCLWQSVNRPAENE